MKRLKNAVKEQHERKKKLQVAKNWINLTVFWDTSNTKAIFWLSARTLIVIS